MNLLRKHLPVAALVLALPALAGYAMSASAQASALVHPRLQGAIDSSSRTTLVGSRPALALSRNDIGAVDGSLMLHGISLMLSQTPEQQSALQALLTAQQDPTSSQYHQWLTPDQYAAQFGVADSDIAATESWLQQQGFTIDSVARSRNRIFFSGTAAQVASAFGAPLHNFREPDGSIHYAPSADLAVPTALSGLVSGIHNLSSFHPKPQIVLPSSKAGAQFTSSLSGNHFIGPGDLATIYDVKPVYQAGYTGINQSIAVVGQSYVYLSDVAAFQSAAGITGKTPNLVLMPNTGHAYFSSNDEAESDLDLEYTSTMAPGAQVYLVYTGSNSNYGAFDAMGYAVDERIASIITVSYGSCEPALGSSLQANYDTYLKQASVQGQTVLVAAGDQGSSACYGQYATTDPSYTSDSLQLAVSYPASSQYATAMGGTEIPTADAAASNSTYWTPATSTTGDIIASAKSYIPEQTWNDDLIEGTLSAGGGGVSIFEPRPSWQTGVTVGGVAIPSGNYRLVPDISLVASNYNAPLIFCTSDTTAWSSTQQNSCNSGFRDSASTDLTVAGGTSFDAPIFAGMLALLNQALNSTGQGLINPTLYSLASNPTTYASAFHDITLAGNQCLAGSSVCGNYPSVSSYAAGTGYDEATGLGSIDFYNLFTAWPRPATASLAETVTTLSAATTTPAYSTADTITISVAPVSGTTVPTGTVNLTLDGNSVGSVTLTNGSATYSFSSSVAGAHVLVATYAGTSTLASSTASITLRVGTIVPTGTFTLSANPTSLSVTAGSSGSITITATPSAGYIGSVYLNVGYAPSTLNNFCLGDTNGGVINITGTAAATDTITFYSNSATCNKLGLTIYQRQGSGFIKITKANPSISSNQPAQPSNQLAQPSNPLRRAALPAALACLLFSFGMGRRRSLLARAGLSLACVFALSLTGFGLTACSSSAAPSSVVTSGSNTTAGTYTFLIIGNDSVDPSIGSNATVTLTVH